MKKQDCWIKVIYSCSFLILLTVAAIGEKKAPQPSPAQGALQVKNYDMFKKLLQTKTENAENDKNKIRREGENVIFPDGKIRKIKKDTQTFFSYNKTKVALLDYYELKLEVVDNGGKEILSEKMPRFGYFDILISDSTMVTMGAHETGPSEKITFSNLYNQKVKILSENWRSCKLSNNGKYVAITTTRPSYFILYNIAGEEILRQKISDNVFVGGLGYQIIFSPDQHFVVAKAPICKGKLLELKNKIEGINKVYLFDLENPHLISEEPLNEE
jgi:hypothetical protein